MTADEARVAAVAIRIDYIVSPMHHDRAKQLMSMAFGVGITLEDSATLIAEQLAKWSRRDAFEAAGIMDPLTKTAKEHIEPLVWYRNDGWDHGGAAETWQQHAEELVAEIAELRGEVAALEGAANRG